MRTRHFQDVLTREGRRTYGSTGSGYGIKPHRIRRQAGSARDRENDHHLGETGEPVRVAP